MHYNKNESKIKILKIPIVWVKISKTSILDHIYILKVEVLAFYTFIVPLEHVLIIFDSTKQDW